MVKIIYYLINLTNYFIINRKQEFIKDMIVCVFCLEIFELIKTMRVLNITISNNENIYTCL